MIVSTELPELMRDLQTDPVRGVPVPWFVSWIDGKPEFRIADAHKLRQAIGQKLCWVCGKPFGKVERKKPHPLMIFVLGPMCTINRVSAEPPCHYECALFSALNCPFLTRPLMDRREQGMETYEAQGAGCAGVMIKRNPGCVALWSCLGYRLQQEGRGVLFQVGEPARRVEWYAEGRQATRAEVVASIESGLPLLEEMAAQQPGAIEELRRMQRQAATYLPAGAACP